MICCCAFAILMWLAAAEVCSQHSAGHDHELGLLAARPIWAVVTLCLESCDVALRQFLLHKKEASKWFKTL